VPQLKYEFYINRIETHLGWLGGIGLRRASVLHLKVSGSILSDANLSGLI